MKNITTIVCFSILILGYSFLVILFFANNGYLRYRYLGIIWDMLHSIIILAFSIGTTLLRLFHVLQLKTSFHGSICALNNRLFLFFIIVIMVTFIEAIIACIVWLVWYWTRAWQISYQDSMNIFSMLIGGGLLIQSLLDGVVCCVFNKNL